MVTSVARVLWTVSAFALVVAACSTAAEDDPDRAALQGPNTIALATPPTAEVAALACAAGDPGTLASDWEAELGTDDGIEPIIVSSMPSVGPGRLLMTLTGADHRVIAAPDISVEAAFYALERDPSTPVAQIAAPYLDLATGRGLYRAAVELDCWGTWGVEVTATMPDGEARRARLDFRVAAAGPTPAIGEPAPRSETPTASTRAEVARISTDPNPFPGAFERTVGEVVTSGQPSIVLFATPAFCQTGSCGPTVNLVKSVVLDYRDDIGFVNVEPYELHETDLGIQPRLDEEGRLIPVRAAVDYGIPVEPYVFVVDADGDIFAAFEGFVGSDELVEAVEAALAHAGSA